jgi:hypothetical protein
MAKALTTVTQAWQQIATGPAVFTIDTVGKGSIIFNETENDATAYRDAALPGDQFEQGDIKITKVRATGDGWKVLTDGVL